MSGKEMKMNIINESLQEAWILNSERAFNLSFCDLL